MASQHAMQDEPSYEELYAPLPPDSQDRAVHVGFTDPCRFHGVLETFKRAKGKPGAIQRMRRYLNLSDESSAPSI